VKGKSTTLGRLNVKEPVSSIRIIGRQDATNSERLADFLLLGVLQGKKTFQNSPFIRLFWFPGWKKFRPPEDTAILQPEKVEIVLRAARLNESQERVVRMAGEKERCMIVHGTFPPRL
jgi:regulator of nonsense transcripts 1